MEITAQMIKDAYEKTELLPLQAQWTDKTNPNGKIDCACGLSALYAAQTSIDELQELLDIGTSVLRAISEKLGTNRDFLAGFVDAFDSLDTVIDDSFVQEFKDGYKVGTEARKLVFNETEADNANQTV